MSAILVNLIAHMRWADVMFADALERDAPDDPDTTRLFAHVAAVEHLWYARIVGRAADHAVWPSLSVSQSRALAAAHADLFDRLVRDADATTLGRVVTYGNSAGHEYQSSVVDIVSHVAMHGTHHRGQIARQLRAAGHEPPYTDYIQYARRDQTK